MPAHLSGETVLVASNGTVLKVIKDNVQVALHLIDPHRGRNITVDHHQPLHWQAKYAKPNTLPATIGAHRRTCTGSFRASGRHLSIRMEENVQWHPSVVAEIYPTADE